MAAWRQCSVSPGPRQFFLDRGGIPRVTHSRFWPFRLLMRPQLLTRLSPLHCGGVSMSPTNEMERIDYNPWRGRGRARAYGRAPAVPSHMAARVRRPSGAWPAG
jgi:hypothetical protein